MTIPTPIPGTAITAQWGTDVAAQLNGQPSQMAWGIESGLTSDADGDVTISFGQTFPATPLVFVERITTSTFPRTALVLSRTTTTVTIRFFDSSGPQANTPGIAFFWLALARP